MQVFVHDVVTGEFGSKVFSLDRKGGQEVGKESYPGDLQFLFHFKMKMELNSFTSFHLFIFLSPSRFLTVSPSGRSQHDIPEFYRPVIALK